MPHRIKRPSPRPAKARELLQALIEELRNPKASGQPVIIEEELGKNGAVQVLVIWDLWEELQEPHRFEIIREAYAKIKGEEFGPKIRLAVGVTFPEAAAIGYLPYKVVPVPRRVDPSDMEKYRQAMVAEGASTLDNPSKPMLRFASLEEADACKRRLEERLPNSSWTIVQEISASY